MFSYRSGVGFQPRIPSQNDADPSMWVYNGTPRGFFNANSSDSYGVSPRVPFGVVTDIVPSAIPLSFDEVIRMNDVQRDPIMQSKIKELQEENDDLRDHVDALHTELSTLDSSTRDRVSKLNKKIASLMAANKEVSDRNLELATANQNLAWKNFNLRAENGALRAKLELSK